MQTYRGVDLEMHKFLISLEGKYTDSFPCRFTPWERTYGINLTRGWVDLRAGNDSME
jgi:hypothetical protein